MSKALNIIKEIAAVLGNDLVVNAAKNGWHRGEENAGIYKNVGDRKQFQIYIEFCIGDFCVGLYRRHISSFPDLIGDKKRCYTVEQAFKRAEFLEKYVNHFGDNIPLV